MNSFLRIVVANSGLALNQPEGEKPLKQKDDGWRPARPKTTDEFVSSDTKAQDKDKKEGNPGLTISETYDEDGNLKSKIETEIRKEGTDTITIVNGTDYENGNVKEKGTAKYVNNKRVLYESYGANGELRYKEKFDYDKDGNLVTETHFRSNGTKDYSRNYEQKFRDVYDKNDRPLYREEGIFSARLVMYALDENPLTTFDSGTLKKEINSAERYLTFEKLVERGDINISDEVKKEIRGQGKALCGVTEKQKELEKQCGIKFDLEPPNPPNYTEKQMPLEKVLQFFEDLDKQLIKYPSNFLKNENIAICLSSELKHNDNGSRAGGLCVDGKIIYLTNAHDFDHEFYHKLDYKDGKQDLNNPTWEAVYEGNYPGNKGYAWHNNLTRHPEPPPGFDIVYSMTQTDDHQADIAERMISDRVKDLTKKPAGKDFNTLVSVSPSSPFFIFQVPTPALANKALHNKRMEAHKKQITDEYKKWSGGLMDEEYFSKWEKGEFKGFTKEDWEKYWLEKAEKKNTIRKRAA